MRGGAERQGGRAWYPGAAALAEARELTLETTGTIVLVLCVCVYYFGVPSNFSWSVWLARYLRLFDSFGVASFD